MNNLRTCPNCNYNKVQKPTDSYCKECARIRTIERQQRFKTACVQYKSTQNETQYGTCESCNQTFADAQLCLRHRQKSPTNIKISKLTGAVPLKPHVLEELDKCDLICHNCERKIYRSKRPATKLKRRALEYLGGACACGADGPPSALEFHHEDPSVKTVQLGDRGLKSWAQVQGDLDHCSIICANCHSLHHAEEKAQERKDLLMHYKEQANASTC